jgi:hypothetical protein
MTDPERRDESRERHVDRDGDPNTDEDRENDCPHLSLRLERLADSARKKGAK